MQATTKLANNRITTAFQFVKSDCDPIIFPPCRLIICMIRSCNYLHRIMLPFFSNVKSPVTIAQKNVESGMQHTKRKIVAQRAKSDKNSLPFIPTAAHRTPSSFAHKHRSLVQKPGRA